MPISLSSSAARSLLPLQRRISQNAWLDERLAVEQLLIANRPLASLEESIFTQARQWIEAMRERGTASGIEPFLHEYGLESDEGAALMCLAEALLRIPDAATADALIHTTFDKAQWEHHLGMSDSLFVNASSWGLLLTGKIARLNQNEGPAALLARLAGKLGEPVVREALKAAMRVIGGRFVLGETTKQALVNARPWHKQGYRFSFDILGEGARSDGQAQAYMQAYREAIALIGEPARGLPLFDAPGISVKLSALHPRYQLTQHKRVMGELLPRLKEIMLLAKQHNIAVSIDAEEANKLDIEMLVFAELFTDAAFAEWNGIGFVAQAYQKRSLELIDYLAQLAKQCRKTIPLRLVKGAYWDSEIKAAQIAGLPSYPVFTRKEHTDLSYTACAHKILAAGDSFHPQFATHNARTAASILAMVKSFGLSRDMFEFQRLHGMGEALHSLLAEEYACRIYAPIGEHKDLLAYLIRRLLENGANTSFVHLLMDEDTSPEKLLANPMVLTQGHGASPNPATPLPVKLYGKARRNSTGMDLGNLADCEHLEAGLATFDTTEWKALPQAPSKEPLVSVHEPARRTQLVGEVQPVSKEGLIAAIEKASGAFPGWAATSQERRAHILELAADSIEQQRHECIALLVREAGRTMNDAIAEIREAADFCRYYAAQARRLMADERLRGPTGESNLLTLAPRGVFGCISPWNFPLSIFVGQMAAALVTGNTVIAKPAEQTPLIAAFAVKLLHEAGIPKDALQLAPGDGEIGSALVNDARIAGVVFTGSFEVAQSINRALAARNGPIVPLIAETGGQNAMIVDSSALLEQAVDDIILSAFGSAGQRCSSLRVLYVQEDIAGALLQLLADAMQELVLGNPMHFSTDIGPVIDAAAHAMLSEHIARMKKEAKFVANAPLPPDIAEEGYYIAPHLFEIDSIKRLMKEIFGPILHVIRFESGMLEDVCDEINSSGYGLTFGMHSRIKDHIDLCCARIHAGNLYINRSMTGAVVGVQPFGGEGLSGTGPKAGGPHYLTRFVTERAFCANTAAIGGNLSLLSGES